MKSYTLLLATLAHTLFAGSSFAQEIPSFPKPPPHQDTAEKKEERMHWFNEARFGMFIHWGLYSQLAGEWQGKRTGFGAEWIQERFHIPASVYMPLAKQWNPTKYDPRAWVRQMKAAGVRYICITSKHHDGFCLWPTKLNNDWNIAVTPYGKDRVKSISASLGIPCTSMIRYRRYLIASRVSFAEMHDLEAV